MKKFFIFNLLLCFIFFVLTSHSFAIETNPKATVNVQTLNVRSGAGKEFEIVDKISKNSQVEILASLNNWSVVKTEKNIIGVVNNNYLNFDNSNSTPTSSTELNAVEKSVSQSNERSNH